VFALVNLNSEVWILVLGNPDCFTIRVPEQNSCGDNRALFAAENADASRTKDDDEDEFKTSEFGFNPAEYRRR
jgi:hypothetical protein